MCVLFYVCVCVATAVCVCVPLYVCRYRDSDPDCDVQVSHCQEESCRHRHATTAKREKKAKHSLAPLLRRTLNHRNSNIVSLVVYIISRNSIVLHLLCYCRLM